MLRSRPTETCHGTCMTVCRVVLCVGAGQDYGRAYTLREHPPCAGAMSSEQNGHLQALPSRHICQHAGHLIFVRSCAAHHSARCPVHMRCVARPPQSAGARHGRLSLELHWRAHHGLMSGSRQMPLHYLAQGQNVRQPSVGKAALS